MAPVPSVTLDLSGVSGSVGGNLTLTNGVLHLVSTPGHWHLLAGADVAVTGGPSGFALSGSLAVDAGDAVSTTVTGAGLQLAIGEVRATGTLGVTVASGTTTITLTGGTLKVGDAISITDAGGTVVLGTTSSLSLTGTADVVLGAVEIKGTVGLDTTSGPVLRLSNAQVLVAGQTLTGTLTVSRDATTHAVTITAQNLGVTFGTIATLSAGSLSLTVSPAGVVGTATATAAVTVGGLSIPSSTVTLRLDSTGPRVLLALSVTIPSSSPASVGGGSISGTLAIEKRADGTVVVAGTGLSASFSGGSLTGGTGVFVVPSGATGIAGYLSGNVVIGTAAAVQGSVRLNTTGSPVDVTVDAGGTSLHVVFGADEHNVFAATVSGALDFGPISIEGTVTFTSGTGGSEVFGGTGLTIFFGSGPLTLANGERNPVAQGLVITDASIGLVKTATGYAVDATGQVALIGLGQVTLGGQLRVRYSNTGAVDQIITVGTDSLHLVFSGNLTSVTGTGLTLAVQGQTLTTDLTVTQTAGGLTLAVTNLSGALTVGGAPVLQVSAGSGTVTLGAGGASISDLGLHVRLAVPGLVLEGSWQLSSDPAAGTTTLAATGQSLTIGSTTLQADVTVVRRTGVGGTQTTVTLANGVLLVKTSESGSTLLDVHPVTGSLQITPDGVVGSLTGTVVTSPGNLLTGQVGVAVDTAAGTLAVTLTGAHLTFSGVTLTGDLSLTRTSAADGSGQVTVTVSNASLDLPGIGVTHGAGSLVTTTTTGGTTTYAGSLSADLALALTGVSASGSVAIAVDSAAATLTVKATGLTLQVAGQSLGGDLTVTRTSASTTITVAHGSLDVGAGLLTLGDVSATVVLGTTGLTSLAASGTPSLHVPGLSVTATTVAVSYTSGAVRVSLTGAQLVASGLTLAADLTVTTGTDAQGRRTLSVAIASVSGTNLLSVAGVLVAASGTGTVVSDATGTTGELILGGTSLVGLGGATASATSVALRFAGDSTRIAVAGAHLVVSSGGSDYGLAGDLTVERAGGTTVVGFSNLTLTIGSQNLVTLGEGALVVPTTGGVAGYFSGAGSGTFGGVSLTGTVLARLNTTGGAVHTSVEVGGRTLAVDFDANGFSISLVDATLTIGNLITVQGSFTFGDCGSGCQQIAAQGVRIFVGRGPAFFADGGVSPLATGVLISNATLAMRRVGGTTYAVVADGTAQIVGVDGVSLAGTVHVAYNDTGSDVSTSIAIPGSSAAPVGLVVANGTRSVSITGATLTIAGQGLTADLAVDRTAEGDTVLAFAHATLTLGPASLTDGSGVIVLTSAGAAGRVAGTLSLAVPGASFGAGLALAVNTTASEVHRSITLGSGDTARLDLSAGPYLRIDGTAVTLTLAGQTITADVALTRTATGTTLGLSRVSLGFATTAGYGVSLSQGSGILVVTGTGIAGRLTGVVGVTLPAGVSATGTLTVAVNTGTAAVSSSIVVGASTQVIDVPGGPYLRFEATGLVLTVAGQQLSGDFSFEKVTTDAGATLTRIAATHVTASLGGMLRLTDGTALILLTGTGLAGSIGGTVALTVPGVAVAGSLTLQLNTTGGDVDETFRVAGVPTNLTLTADTAVSVVGTGLSLTIAGQTLTGDLTVTRSVDAAGRSTLTLVGQNLRLVLGSGASTVTLTQNGAATLVLTPSGMTADLGVDVAVSVPNVAVTGTVTLHVDTAAGVLRASGTTVHLAVLGQTLDGSFAFEQTGTGATRVARIAISGGHLSLAGGIAVVDDATGLFVVGNGGLAGQLSASLSLGTTAVGLSGRFALALNTTGGAVSQVVTVGGAEVALQLPAGPYLRISGTGVVATVADQVLSGDISLERSGSTIHLTAANVRLQLGDGARALVRLTDGAADLTLTGTGASSSVTGTVSGTVALVNVPGVTLSGSFVATVAPGTFSVTGTNVVLGLAGQSLSASSISFTKTMGVLTLAIDGGELAFTDGSGRALARATAITGSLTFISAALDTGSTPTGGFYGTIGGKLAIDVPDVKLDTTVSVRLNTTGAPQGTLTAGQVDVLVSGADLVVAGQTLHIDTLTVSSSGSGPAREVLLTVTGLTLSLGPVTISGGNGAFHIAGGAIAGLASGTVSMAAGSSFAIAGTATFQINTGTTAVTVPDPAAPTTTKTLPAGPYLRVSVGNGSNAVLTVGTLGFAGTVLVERSTRTGYGTLTATLATVQGTSVATGDVERRRPHRPRGGRPVRDRRLREPRWVRRLPRWLVLVGAVDPHEHPDAAALGERRHRRRGPRGPRQRRLPRPRGGRLRPDPRPPQPGPLERLDPDLAGLHRCRYRGDDGHRHGGRGGRRERRRVRRPGRHLLGQRHQDRADHAHREHGHRHRGLHAFRSRDAVRLPGQRHHRHHERQRRRPGRPRRRRSPGHRGRLLDGRPLPAQHLDEVVLERHADHRRHRPHDHDRADGHHLEPPDRLRPGQAHRHHGDDHRHDPRVQRHRHDHRHAHDGRDDHHDDVHPDDGRQQRHLLDDEAQHHGLHPHGDHGQHRHLHARLRRPGRHHRRELLGPPGHR